MEKRSFSKHKASVATFTEEKTGGARMTSSSLPQSHWADVKTGYPKTALSGREKSEKGSGNWEGKLVLKKGKLL